MDYALALEARQEMGDIFMVEEIKFSLFVTPANSKDFKSYCDNFDPEAFTDESAVLYCNDAKYEVRAIRIEDGVLKWEFPELQRL